MRRLQVAGHKSQVKRRVVLCLCVFVLLSCSFCLAKDINFDVTVDRRKVSLGSSIEFKLTFFGVQDVPAVDLPQMKDFDSTYIGPEVSITIVNGRASSSITHAYRLIPRKTGSLAVPSLSLEYKGETFVSDSIPIEVVRGPLKHSGTAAAGADDLNLEDRVFITMQVGKDRAYVNEEIPLTIRLYADNNLNLQYEPNPQFYHEGFSLGEFSGKKDSRVVKGIKYNIIEFNTKIFGMLPGQLKLGPVKLRCNLIVTKKSKRSSRFPFFDDDFFGNDVFERFFTRYQTYPLDLQAEEFFITIVELPKNDRPKDFNGAIGKYDFELEAEPKEINVGDPITLRMLVSGEGNLKTVQSPVLDAGRDFKIYDPEVKQDQKSKLFEQVIIPARDTLKEIPKISFSFFDPGSETYKTIVRGPVFIKVNPIPEGQGFKIFEAPGQEFSLKSARETLGADIVYIKDFPGKLKRKGVFFSTSKLFFLIQIIPLVGIIFAFIFQKKRQRLKTDISYARRLRAPRSAKKNLLKAQGLLDEGKAAKFYRMIFKTLQEYVGDKFHLPTKSITSSVTEELKKQGTKGEILRSLRECFEECDRARYAPASISKEQMQKTFNLLEGIIDKLERVRL